MSLADKAKIIEELLISFANINASVVKAAVSAHDAVFPRHERPDYRTYAGQYCASRIPSLRGEPLWIASGNNRLRAHLYSANAPRGLVVFAHGIRAGADEYLPIFAYLVNAGYSVLAHNVTGTYESEGSSTVGMCQSLVDMDRVLDYVEAEPALQALPLFTMGHSWGAYAALSVLALGHPVRAAAGIAAMYNATEAMRERGAQYVGPLARITDPILLLYQKLLFGDYADVDTIAGINTSGIPVLVVHGKEDEVISYDRTSVLAHRDEITNPHVVYHVGCGVHGDHNNIWHSARAAAYQKQVDAALDALAETEKAAYMETVDHALYSEVNEELMSAVVQLFDSAL